MKQYWKCRFNVAKSMQIKIIEPHLFSLLTQLLAVCNKKIINTFTQ